MALRAVVQHNGRTLRITLNEDATSADLAREASLELGVKSEEIQLIAQGSEMEPTKSLKSLGEFYFRTNAVHVRKLDSCACREWQRKGRCKAGHSCPMKDTHTMHFSPRYVEHHASTSVTSSPSPSPPASPPVSPAQSSEPPVQPVERTHSPNHYHIEAPPVFPPKPVLLSEPSTPPQSPPVAFPAGPSLGPPSIPYGPSSHHTSPNSLAPAYPYEQYAQHPYPQQYGQYEQYDDNQYNGWSQGMSQGTTLLLSDKQPAEEQYTQHYESYGQQYDSQHYDLPPQQLPAEQAWMSWQQQQQQQQQQEAFAKQPVFYGHSNGQPNYVSNAPTINYGAVNYNQPVHFQQPLLQSFPMYNHNQGADQVVAY